jgi:small-conductance mechanosensitive channel
VFVLYTADVDPLAGEDLQSKSAAAAANLQVAFDEAGELRTPAKLATDIGLALAATLIYAVALWVVIIIYRSAAGRLSSLAERRLRQLKAGELIVGVARAPVMVARTVALACMVLAVLFTYMWVSAVLRRIPYTRPWGESLRSGLVSVAAAASRSIVDALPDLFTVLAIVIITRFLIRLTNLAFRAVEEQRITISGIYPETAQPSRRIAVALLWLCALIVSYSYLPGSDSEVFKGVSVFVGLIISLGSSGVMNQIMSGFMVTYSRALRVGDFVKVADVEGTVVHLGALSTKIKTARNEEITIPNAVVVSHAATNYSRHANDGVFAPTSVTIGYDVPWRQVQALLLLAAERTPGVRQEPKPVVLQAGLDDFYVRYTLLVCLEQPNRRYAILGALHAHILDAFNEYGVQIMSPNYEADPSGPKVVPRNQWYAAPAPSAPELAARTPPTSSIAHEGAGSV